MSLRDEILALDPALLATRDDAAIAAAVSVGRTRIVSTPIGFGTVLDSLGPTEGAAALDALEALGVTVPAVKWAMRLLDRSILDLGMSSVRGQIDALVGTVFTAEQAATLKALAAIPDPVTEYDVRVSMYDADTGEWRGA